MSILYDKNKFTCPITLQLFCNPIIAEDGNFYEKDAFFKLIHKKNKIKSPLSGFEISSKYFICNSFNNELKEFISNNPELKSEQYSPDFKEEYFYQNLHNINKTIEYIKQFKDTEIKIKFKKKHESDLYKLLINQEFLNTIKNINFNMEHILRHLIISHKNKKIDKDIFEKYYTSENIFLYIKYIIENFSFEDFKYYIDTYIQDINIICPKSGYNLLHYCVKYGNYEFCKYLLEKNIDINNKSFKNKHTPLKVSFVNSNDINICKLLMEYYTQKELIDMELNKIIKFIKIHICEKCFILYEKNLLEFNIKFIINTIDTNDDMFLFLNYIDKNNIQLNNEDKKNIYRIIKLINKINIDTLIIFKKVLNIQNIIINKFNCKSELEPELESESESESEYESSDCDSASNYD